CGRGRDVRSPGPASRSGARAPDRHAASPTTLQGLVARTTVGLSGRTPPFAGAHGDHPSTLGDGSMSVSTLPSTTSAGTAPAADPPSVPASDLSREDR